MLQAAPVVFAEQAASAFFLVSLIVVEAQVLVPKKSTQHSQVYSFLHEDIEATIKAAAANKVSFFIFNVI